MNSTLNQLDKELAGAPETSKELVRALQSFARWMNRPVMRVQVFTWQTANQMFEVVNTHFRTTSQFRKRYAANYDVKESKTQRELVAQRLRLYRKQAKIHLPEYVESRAEWIHY